MEFDTTTHPDNLRWRQRATRETHELPIRPADFVQFRFYAQGMADTLGKPVYIWINNDPSNSMACSPTVPEDDRTYAIIRVIHPHERPTCHVRPRAKSPNNPPQGNNRTGA